MVLFLLLLARSVDSLLTRHIGNPVRLEVMQHYDRLNKKRARWDANPTPSGDISHLFPLFYPIFLVQHCTDEFFNPAR